jgi:TRAP-type C4-dicarboxylate transport system permease small subunit
VRRFIVSFGERTSRLGLFVAAACLIVVVLINGANVVARYLFHAAFSWAEEAMLFFMIAGVFWGAVAVAWRQAEIRIDAFVARTGQRAQRVLDLIASLIAIAILVWLLLVGWRVTSQLFAFDQRSTAMNLPMWIPHSALGSGLLLLILMTIARLFVHRDAGRPADQAPDKCG